MSTNPSAKRPSQRRPRDKRPAQKSALGAPGAASAPEARGAAGGSGEPMRIAKALARAGLCSRREAERWIDQGRVSVNGKILKTPAFEVTTKDKVVVDGKPLPATEPVRLWRYHKPKGLVTTHKDPQGRPTVFAELPPELPRVVSVGRLDFNSEGLLLLTNDGTLARHMELPATGWLRRYRVRAHGRVSQAQLDALKDGIEIEGVRYGPIEATLDSVQGANAWITIGLREGKNREVRRILAHLGVEVNRLIRISYGPFQLLDLKPGTVEPVKRRVLAEQLGPRIAVRAGARRAERARARTTHRARAQEEGRRGGMRIVGGKFRGRAIAVPKHEGLRPTADRVRESLFNILVHGIEDFALEGARAVDLFAGTGALGLEALSRGALFCLFVEESPEARALIRDNIEALQLTGETRIFRRDATDLGPAGTLAPFTLAFLDPALRQGAGREGARLTSGRRLAGAGRDRRRGGARERRDRAAARLRRDRPAHLGRHAGAVRALSA